VVLEGIMAFMYFSFIFLGGLYVFGRVYLLALLVMVDQFHCRLAGFDGVCMNFQIATRTIGYLNGVGDLIELP